jgi:hypothetical protein
MQTSLRVSLGLLPFSLLIALTACTGQVIGGGSSTSSPPPNGSNTGDDGEGGCWGGCEPVSSVNPINAVAFRASTVGWSDGSGGSGGASTSGSASSSSGGGVDPNTLYLSIGDQYTTCADPIAPIPCGGYFNVTIGIPPALVQLGSLPLSTPGLISVSFETEGGVDPGACGGGGGSYVDGTLTITDIETTTVSFTLSGTDGFDVGPESADGVYVATICGQ